MIAIPICVGLLGVCLMLFAISATLIRIAEALEAERRDITVNIVRDIDKDDPMFQVRR